MSYATVLQLVRQMRKSPTKAEAFFWEQVRKKKLGNKKFLRQYLIQHTESDGVKRFFIADFYCHEKKLIVEIDGDVHLQKEEYDKIRENILLEMGFQIVRFRNEMVLHRWLLVEERLLELLV